MTRLRDGLYNKRRVICGCRVLVSSLPNPSGLVRESFAVRIKHPAGDIDLEMTAYYYWQVFDAVQKMWPTLVQRITKV